MLLTHTVPKYSQNQTKTIKANMYLANLVKLWAFTVANINLAQRKLGVRYGKFENSYTAIGY